MTTDERTALQIHSLTKTFPGGVRALDGISFDVARGEFFGLLGPNGAGKTTLISCLAGLTQPTSGEMTVLGIDCARERRRASEHLGIVPQEITFDPFLTVWETLRFQSGYWGLRKNDAWLTEIVERLGLADKKASPMRALSGGMKRRVLVAQALVHRPPVIVLDEPTAGVDVELRENLWAFIGDLHRAGHTIVLTTHNLAEAQAMCSRVAILKNGRIAALDRTDRLLARVEGRMMRFRLTGGVLPEGLKPMFVREVGENVTLRIESDDDIGAALAALKAAGLTAEGLTVGQADLEDVFLAITGEAR